MRLLFSTSLTAAALLVSASAAMAQTKVGDVRPHTGESLHPYPAGEGGDAVVWQEVVQSPGAVFIRVHFEDLEIGGGDVLTISSPDGSQVWALTGRGPRGSGDAWSFAIDGDTAIVRIHGGSRPAFGYRITEVVHGTMSPRARLERQVETVCGSDGREPIACHTNDPRIAQRQSAIARLLYQSGNAAMVCTGALVRGAIDSLLLTNQHCLASQAEVNTLQVTFGHQADACTGGQVAEGAVYAGDVLVRANPSLDYSFVTLNGNPEAVWGELTPTTVDATSGTPFWLIQHPSGGPKEIGYWEDASQTTQCTVAKTFVNIDTYEPGSQMEYGCDTIGGSSGSPLINADSGHIVGLHHLGAFPPPQACLNAATMMRFICEDAGNLLGCDQPAPGYRRYFAEGAEGFFQTSVGVFNPDAASSALVSVEAAGDDGNGGRASFRLGPRENQIVSLRDLVGETAAAISVASDIPIVTDRYMRWGTPEQYGSSMERGITEPTTEWHFGEGATGPFQLFYLFQNPGAEDARVTVTYLRERGGPIERTYTVAAFSRYTVLVNAEPGLQAANVSAEVTANVPIVAERSMYLHGGGLAFRSGTTGAGATSLSSEWYFAEGATGFFDEFLLFSNSRSEPIEVSAQYLLPDGSVIQKTYPVSAQTRRTVWVNTEHPRLANTAVSVRLSASAGFIAERAMWWPSNLGWRGGHVSLGSTQPGTVWGVANAGLSCNEDVYVLVSNASETRGRVRVTAYSATGEPTAKEFELAGNARLTVSTREDLGIACGAVYSALAESVGAQPVPISVEVSRYFFGSVPFEGGATARATKVQ